MKFTPIKIVNPFIPFDGFKAMATLFIVWIRKECINRIDIYTENHEKIHCIQQVELAITGLIVGLLFSVILSNWWWMLLVLGFPFGLYILCWLIELILPPFNNAYKNICFESEALYNECDLEYLSKRKLFQFSFFKYISNKKYPYISKSKRLELHKK
jgi:hypothetical protein